MPKLDLEQHKKRAKELVRAHRLGEADAIARVHANLPRAAGLVPDAVRALAIKLADAQLVVAREAGFPTWPRLKRAAERGPIGGEPSALEQAVRAHDVEAVRAALAADPPPPKWIARESLEVAVEHDDRDIIRALLAYGAWPDHAGRRWGHGGGCLHAAVLLDRPRALIELLIGGGATLGARDRDGRTPLAIAHRCGRDDLIPLLGDFPVSELDRALGACVRGARPARPADPLRRTDHQFVCWAVRRGHHAAVPALLGLGLDPDMPDDDGEPPLHCAVTARAPDVIDVLVAGGATVDALDFAGETALVRAYREPDRAMREAMVERLRRGGAKRARPRDLSELFEAAADAVVAGDLATLTRLLDREPALATARSTRPHRCTLLHYIGANGVEDERQRSPKNAGAVAELLLARGADPNALAATYGGGPAQTPLLLAVTSVHPDAAGVIGDIITALVAGRARLDGVDGDCEPINQARKAPLAALIAAGARIDVVRAAALGLRERVAALVRTDGTLAPDAKLGAQRAVPDRDVLDAALRAACFGGHRDVAADLLRAGAAIDSRDREGMTPLHLAAWVADVPTVELLVAHGAPLEAKNDYGGTVLDFLVWVVENQWRDRDYAAVARILIDAGADRTAVNWSPTGHADFDAVFAPAATL